MSTSRPQSDREEPVLADIFANTENRPLSIEMTAGHPEGSRSVPDNDSLIRSGALVVNLCSGEASLDGQPIPLTTTESRLLCFLTSHPGCSFTRRQIIDAVQGRDYPATDRSVDVQVNGLRKKLQGAGSLIETVRGTGYAFRE